MIMVCRKRPINLIQPGLAAAAAACDAHTFVLWINRTLPDSGTSQQLYYIAHRSHSHMFPCYSSTHHERSHRQPASQHVMEACLHVPCNLFCCVFLFNRTRARGERVWKPLSQGINFCTRSVMRADTTSCCKKVINLSLLPRFAIVGIHMATIFSYFGDVVISYQLCEGERRDKIVWNHCS